jgi:recombination protein RecR
LILFKIKNCKFKIPFMFPKSFKKLIDHFASLPSVGPKMAERLVLYLFKQETAKLKDFSESLENLKNLKECRRCFNIAEEDLCEICQNSQREQGQLCVVEEPLDIISLEKTGAYKGLYHVLGGVIFLGKENSPLRINELLRRIPAEKIQEVILATNPTTEGDATALYLKSKLKSIPDLKITRLARGLSTGGDIEYADEITLGSAINNRREL